MILERRSERNIDLLFHLFMHSMVVFFKDFIYLFLEGKGGRKRGREGNIEQLPLTCPQRGTRPTTQAHVLAGGQTGESSIHRAALSPLSHTSHGSLADSCMCPDGDRTRSLGVSVRCSNQLSYPVRARSVFFLMWLNISTVFCVCGFSNRKDLPTFKEEL